MKYWDTLSGRKTSFGKPGSSAKIVAQHMEQDERLRQHLERKKCNEPEEIIPYNRLDITDEEISLWVTEIFNDVFI